MGPGRAPAKLTLGCFSEIKPLHRFRAVFANAGPNNVGVNCMDVIAQAGHAETKANHTQKVGDLQDRQVRTGEAIAEAFLAPLLSGREGMGRPGEEG